MSKPTRHPKVEGNLDPPPEDALARLQLRLTQSHPAAAPNLQSAPAPLFVARKNPRGRKRLHQASTVPGDEQGYEIAVENKKQARVRIETWVPPSAANQLDAIAQTHGLPPGTLVYMLARGLARVMNGHAYPEAAHLRQKPWHVRWTISQIEFTKLEPVAALAGQSVGSYCVTRALVALSSASTASTAPLLLTRTEREILAGLHRVIARYTLIIELKSGTDAVLSQLRQTALRMANSGPAVSDQALVEKLGHLVKALTIRARYGADLTEVKQRIHEVAFQSPPL